MRTVMRRPTATVSTALTVPLLLLCLTGAPGSSGPGPAAAPRLGPVGPPGTEQALTYRSPLHFFLSVRRDDQSRVGPAALGQLAPVPSGAALRAVARLAFGTLPGKAGQAVAAEPRAPPAR